MPSHATRRQRWLYQAILLTLTLGIAALVWPQPLGGDVAYAKVSGESMEPGLHTGDLVAVRREKTYGVGDVIAYRIPKSDPGAGAVVIHRVTGGDGDAGYITQGDNRDSADRWRPTDDDVLGGRWFLVPGAAQTVSVLQDPFRLASLLGVLAGMLVYTAKPRQRRVDAATADLQ